MRTAIKSGKVLIDTSLEITNLVLEHSNGTGRISSLSAGPACDIAIDATGLLVLPAIIDIHGDAFERQIQPRPGGGFDLDIALTETDRQLVANGIATAFHGVTWSWEPGLRDAANAHAMFAALDRLRPHLAADTRFHLRHETFNLDAECEIIEWLQAGRVDCLAFNDHMSGTIKDRHRPDKLAVMIARSGLAAAEFHALVERTYERRGEVPGSIERLAQAARQAGIPMLSHDDADAQKRAWFREIGVAISEFPLTAEVAAAACKNGEATIFGAPNVIRGGSHTGCPSAADMVARGACRILASDFYYPALLLAPFKLAALGITPLERAWKLVAENPAASFGLVDRGTIAAGKRADIILVDENIGAQPRVVATLVNGRIRYLADGSRLFRGELR